MVIKRFNPPTRDQLVKMARGDERLTRALEQLWNASGQDLADIQDQIDALTIRVTTNETNIIANAARIKTNEVLLWLSM